ncbi:hypothetical protein HOLleu_27865 [Holothuria leucospilota]|uniref:Uncharacterized protein n=1 Tax=Holothuria leucospilota TaxID=206669 RepID=A0A9Q1BR69_HOLLE|nr:hypothetical protein HOLleu_27865 [Holothuria leucospilota]
MLQQSRKVAQRVIGVSLPLLECLYHEKICNKVKQIMQDPTPLFEHYTYNHSGVRLCPPCTCRARYRYSLVPNSIRIFNSQVRR